MDTGEVEFLKRRIEALERDLRKAIGIASAAVRDAQELAAKAYQRGFREGFDRAFATRGTSSRDSTPDASIKSTGPAAPSQSSSTNDEAPSLREQADAEALHPAEAPTRS